MNLFVIKSISGAGLAQIVRGVLPYVLLLLFGLAAVLLLPELATWLPSTTRFGR
jgi:C4-dicarboxylate transporter DctM subunit